MDRKLGNYTILDEIGRGGMATVYRALQESLNRTVALKELDLSRFRSEPGALERFHLEAQAAASLDHPNIITIYDRWEEGDKAYIAMELIDGVELKEALLTTGAMEYANAVILCLAVSEALHYAHLKKMVHRDVKPGNIMLSATGEVRLMDFGIVSVSGTGDLTVTGQILGTPAYMSPEQIAGEELGPGADLFSLGATLYEMIAGNKPFSGANHIALIQDVLHGQPVPLHELNPEIPESISQAVQKCLEKSPERRYGSMEELSTVLEMVLPLERPNRARVVSQLVNSTREHERTRLHTSASADDRTYAMVPPPVQSGDAAVTRPSAVPPPAATGTSPLVSDSGASIYELEDGPPADLPPLEPDGSMTGSFEIEPLDKKPSQDALALKDVPELDPELDTGRYIEETTAKKAKRSPMLWILPILFLAAGAIWFFAGNTKQVPLLKNVVIPVSMAQITVVAEPEGRVFMDGQLIGSARPSLTFDVEPGLHRLQVRHPQYDPRKFIMELKPGEKKEITVKLGQ